MDKDLKELVDLLLAWWEDAQYWTYGEYGGHNCFNDDPDFITKAVSIKDKYDDTRNTTDQ